MRVCTDRSQAEPGVGGSWCVVGGYLCNMKPTGAPGFEGCLSGTHSAVPLIFPLCFLPTHLAASLTTTFPFSIGLAKMFLWVFPLRSYRKTWMNFWANLNEWKWFVTSSRDNTIESPCPVVRWRWGWEGERECAPSADLGGTQGTTQPGRFHGASRAATEVTLSWAWALVSELPRSPGCMAVHRAVCSIGYCISSTYGGYSTLGLLWNPWYSPCWSWRWGTLRKRWPGWGEGGKALLGNEEGAPNQFVVWEMAQIMVYSANLGACQGRINTAWGSKGTAGLKLELWPRMELNSGPCLKGTWRAPRSMCGIISL